MNFIAGQVTYPESARADGVEGKVFVEFTISETGAVTNAHVIESLAPRFGQRGSRCRYGHAQLGACHQRRQGHCNHDHPSGDV